MLTSEWKEVSAVSNLGEDDDRVVGRIANGTVELAYMAYGGVKIVALEGVKDVPDASSGLPDVRKFNEIGDDYEVIVAVAIDIAGQTVVRFISIDSCDCATCPDDPTVDAQINVDSAEYDADELESSETDLMEVFNLN